MPESQIEGRALVEAASAKLDKMTEDFQAWCEAQHLPLMSADELLADLRENDKGTEEQCSYLRAFMDAWDAVAEEERSAYNGLFASMTPEERAAEIEGAGFTLISKERGETLMALDEARAVMASAGETLSRVSAFLATTSAARVLDTSGLVDRHMSVIAALAEIVALDADRNAREVVPDGDAYNDVVGIARAALAAGPSEPAVPPPCDEARDIIYRLIEWADFTGGWEAPIWDRARAFYLRKAKNPESDQPSEPAPRDWSKVDPFAPGTVILSKAGERNNDDEKYAIFETGPNALSPIGSVYRHGLSGEPYYGVTFEPSGVLVHLDHSQLEDITRYVVL